MKKRKIKGIVITVLLLLVLGAGGVAGARYYLASRAKSVEVVAVSDLNGADWLSYFNESSNTGTVVSDVSQNVYVPEDKVIDEVFVSEGDEVKIGDKLLSYDTTLLELDQELQDLELQELDLEIESAKADLEKLKNTTPVERPAGEDSEEELLGPNLSLPDGMSGDGDDGEDTAHMIQNEGMMLASQDGGTDQTDAPQTEEQPQSETAALQTETQAQSETAAAQNETAAPQGEDAAMQNGQKPEEKQTEYMDINDAPAGDGAQPDASKSADEDEKTKEDKNKPKMNQSLFDFLTHIRVKEITQEGENLLIDTRDGQDAPIKFSADSVKLIPHFKEKKDAHFEKKNTYAMSIRGITLQEDKKGKLYGIAKINGEDYPEIGGYTLIQDPDDNQLVHLTLAFHEGLEEQHKDGAELEDMYAEITLSTKEITGETLTFRTKKEENDIKVQIEQPQPQTDGEESGQSEESEQTSEPESASESGGTEPSEDETEPVGEENAGIMGIDNPMPLDMSYDTESDTGSPDETPAPAKVAFRVFWYHGTNNEANWPSSLWVQFFAADQPQEPVWEAEIKDPGDFGPDPEIETESGEGVGGQPETEPQTEADGDPDPTPETDPDLETADSESESVEQGDTDYVIPPQDNSYSTLEWQTPKAKWKEDLQAPDSYTLRVARDAQGNAVLNYIPHIICEEVDGVYTYTIAMTYLEPEESPLIKLEPLSELTWESGANQKYYKGSGTKDDPYIFFCTDGATIRSSFVNWVLGFDADGTVRLNDGCYVVLEIRESDTITGAFIRSVGLDGTIRMEYGFDPGTYWIFASDSGIVRYEEEVEEPDVSDGGDWFDDPGWSDIGETYTSEELAQAIKDKELELRRLDLDKKEAEMKLRQYNRDLKDSVVVSAVDGYVKSLGTNTNSSEAYMVVTSEGGLYLRTTIGELELDTIQRGDQITATSWETQNQFTASVTEISYFPTTGDSYSYGAGNPNSSNYPVLAHIDDTTGLSPYEMVEVQYIKPQAETDGIYLPVPYIRAENGQSYVYKRDGEGLLKKQYIRTGSTSNDYVEVKEGLSAEDYIAFPYGKNVKNGAKTEVSEESDIY